MENVTDVASYIKSKGNFTNKKVHKIMYYAYALFLVKYNDKYSNDMSKLFDGVFLAFPDGPRETHIYIRELKIKNGLKDNLKLDNKEMFLKEKQNEKFLDHVIEIYGKYSEEELEDMVKREEPWKSTYKYHENIKTIKDKKIFRYYYKKYMEEE